MAMTAGAAEGAGKRFACADYTAGKVFLVGADGKVEWEHPAKNCNDLRVLPNGNLLFSTGHGVLEVTREKVEVFRYESKSEIFACQRLPDGSTFVGECNAGRLIEIAPGGRVVKEIRLLPEGKDGGHAYIRNARKLPDGHYLVSHYGDQAVREYDKDGKIVREIPAVGGPHSAVRLPNGNTLMSNWLGHGQFGKAPHLVEVTPKNEVVWTFADHATMRAISTVIDLATPGDPVAGAILH
ncbi:MAG: hypothetical protein BWK77_02940 [Verrucomicrobia bacterium A1]|nr:MAG: hypothetical protein BWK77_02940 [Verrucomicrobia bacterium A1]